MNNAELFEAYVPTTEWWVLGVKLRPLALGHIILLSRIESVFIAGGKLSFDDLAASVFICANDYRTGVDAVQNPNRYARTMRRWQRKLGFVNLSDQSAEFRKYIETELAEPDYNFPEAGSHSVGCPSVQSVKVALVKLGFSEAELLDRSWRLCVWDYLTSKALDGQITFTDSEAVAEAMDVAKRLKELVDSKGGQWAGSKN